MRVLSLTAKGVLVLLVLLAVLITVRGLMDARIPYDVSTDGVNIPQFTVVEIPFDQNNDFSVAHPFAAGAIIDIDNDGTEELFLGGGPGQSDALLRYVDGAFELIPDAAGIRKPDETASFGASVIDTDGDGHDPPGGRTRRRRYHLHRPDCDRHAVRQLSMRRGCRGPPDGRVHNGTGWLH